MKLILQKFNCMYFHEFGGYTGRYAYYAKYFAEQGYDFVGFDFRGFGKSEGMRGHIERKSNI